MRVRKRAYIPNLGKTFNTYTQRWRIPWSVLNAKERRRRFERARRAHSNGLPIAHIGDFAEFSRRQKYLDRYQPLVTSRTMLGRKMPPLFGTSARTQALAILWSTGPITVRELARARRKDASSTYRMVDGLIRAGLLSKARSGRRYIGVNRTHPAFHNLSILLSALVDRYGVRFPHAAQRRKSLPGRTAPKARPVEEYSFGSPIRSQILILLAAVGSADGRQISRLLARNYCSVCYAMGALERARILRSQPVGGRRVFLISDAYPAAIEYRRFLKAVSGTLPRFRALAKAVEAVTIRYR